MEHLGEREVMEAETELPRLCDELDEILAGCLEFDSELRRALSELPPVAGADVETLGLSIRMRIAALEKRGEGLREMEDELRKRIENLDLKTRTANGPGGWMRPVHLADELSNDPALVERVRRLGELWVKEIEFSRVSSFLAWRNNRQLKIRTVSEEDRKELQTLRAALDELSEVGR